MENTTKKQFPLRLDGDLWDMVQEKAKAERRSVNNYIERLLLKDVGNVPNELTIMAIGEASAGTNLKRIEDLDAFFDDIENEIQRE